MIRGSFRLGVVVTVLAWVGAGIWQYRHLEKEKWLVERHLSPYLGETMPPTEGSWPVYAASPRFMALFEPARISAARNFYEEHVRPLEGEYFVGHGDEFKNWFVAMARLSVEEAPVREAEGVQYRKFDFPGIPIAPRLTYVFFNQNVLLLAGIVSAVTMTIVILSTLAIRWVYRGFRKAKAT